MLPRRLRLSREGFKEKKEITKVRTKHFIFSLKESAQNKGYGIVVSKKVISSAVKRHALKRKIREVVKVLPQVQGSAVLQVHTKNTQLSYSEVKREIENTLVRKRA
jgi:ribonuclease P protein component